MTVVEVAMQEVVDVRRVGLELTVDEVEERVFKEARLGTRVNEGFRPLGSTRRISSGGNSIDLQSVPIPNSPTIALPCLFHYWIASEVLLYNFIWHSVQNT